MTQISPTARKFIRDWGDLADRWDIDRTTAEVHALLFLQGAPLDLRSVADALSLQGDEAAVALEALREMGVARIADRHAGSIRYECPGDVWEMFHAVLESRRKREVEPAVAVIRDAVLRADSDPECDDATRKRLEEMQGFLRDATGFYKELASIRGADMRRLLRMGSKIRRALGLGD